MTRVEKATKDYDTHFGRCTVLRNINRQLERDRKAGILCRNGAGKSTPIRLLAGAELPSAVRTIGNTSVSCPLAFGDAFQGNLACRDDLMFIYRVYGIDYRQRVGFVEEFTELGVHLREPVSLYSRGMLTRLAIALSLATEFDCFLIDEAMVGGDQRSIARASVLVERELNRLDTVGGAYEYYETHTMHSPEEA